MVNKKENLNTQVIGPIIDASNSFIAAKGSMPLNFKSSEYNIIKKKQKLSHNSDDEVSPSLKRKNENASDIPSKKQKLSEYDDDAPQGTAWDGDNYSCAYDALFFILYNIWVAKPQKWKKIFKNSNKYLSALHDGFQNYLTGVDTLEVARDHVRTLLHNNEPLLFPYGHMGISVSALATQMFYPVYKVPQLHLHCSHCNHSVVINDNHVGRIMYVNSNATGSISQILDNHLHHRSQEVCSNCNAPVHSTIHFSETHKLYAVDVTDRSISVSQTIKIQGSVHSTILHLKGLVYHGGCHFTCRFVDQSGNIWYHDGMGIRRTSTKEGKFRTISQPNLKMCKNRKLCLIIYAQNS
jgi:hypothetical protein